MEQNTPNPNGMINGMPPQSQVPAPHERKVGPIIGVLIIVLVLIVVALYFFNSRLNTAPVDTSAQTTTEESVPSASASEVSAEDDVNSLNAELGAELNNVDYSF